MAEESRLVIAGALPTALTSYCSSSCHPPTTSTFLHYQQILTTPCTSLPPSALTQLQALCGTEHRTFVPPIDLNRPDVVSLKRGRPIIRSVAKKSLLSGSRSAVPSKVTNYFCNRDQFGVLDQPHRCILCVWSALIPMTFYLWLLGKIPCHTDHIYQ